MKMIIDTDPGIDDAMAFYYAFKSERCDVIALTTVFGNVTIADATKNALWLGDTVDAPIPVYRGASKPRDIAPNPPTVHVHGLHGFGDVDIDDVIREAESESAAEFLVGAAASSPGELTVCAIGPLTNIALALEIDPDFISNLKRLVIMGGSLDAGGNITPHAEANFWNDPHAAKSVLTAPGDGEIVIVGLDVTTKIAITQSEIDTLAVNSPKVGGFLKKIGEFYMRFYESVNGYYEAYLHDPAAVIACETPEFFEMIDVRLNVVTQGENIGEMIRDKTVSRVCKVCIASNSDAIVNQFVDVTSTNL